MAEYIVQVKTECRRCGGSGDYPHGAPTGDCEMCHGTGVREINDFDLTELDDKLTDILDKCNDILERVSE